MTISIQNDKHTAYYTSDQQQHQSTRFRELLKLPSVLSVHSALLSSEKQADAQRFSIVSCAIACTVQECFFFMLQTLPAFICPPGYNDSVKRQQLSEWQIAFTVCCTLALSIRSSKKSSSTIIPHRKVFMWHFWNRKYFSKHLGTCLFWRLYLKYGHVFFPLEWSEAVKMGLEAACVFLSSFLKEPFCSYRFHVTTHMDLFIQRYSFL